MIQDSNLRGFQMGKITPLILKCCAPEMQTVRGKRAFMQMFLRKTAARGSFLSSNIKELMLCDGRADVVGCVSLCHQFADGA